jgi:hypothetical protein
MKIPVDLKIALKIPSNSIAQRIRKKTTASGTLGHFRIPRHATSRAAEFDPLQKRLGGWLRFDYKEAS